MTLTKAELADILVDKVSNVTKNDAKEIVELFFEEIRSTLASGEEIKISGFGNFQLRDKPQRPGRNPKTGGGSADYRPPRGNFPCQPETQKHGGTLL